MATRFERVSTGVKTLAFAVGLGVLEVVSYVSLKRHGEGIDGMPTVAWAEYPDISPGLLEKFSSFDDELGWCPQPNNTKQKDTGDHLPGEEVEKTVEYSTDEYGSRVCPACDRGEGDGDVTVSTYGDSYCFCRGVNDDETFQHYLAENLDTHVANYGAGNYGFDQALERLKRTYDDDPADYVFVAVTASSIARILSTWKHYQEFGNVLAVKPRYELEDDGSLSYVESPLDEKEELLDVEQYGEYLQSHDGHYERWFRPRLASFPYTTDFLRNPAQVRYAAYSEAKNLESRFGVSIPGVDVDARQSRAETALEQAQAAYHDDLFDEHDDLFEALVDEFVDYADDEEFTPVFVMVQQLRYAKYEEDHGPVYGDFLERMDEKHDSLVTVDVADHLARDGGDVESLYVRRGEGGHYSPETNERIADLLTEVVFDDAPVSTPRSASA